jgi:patatin-like phospholipase/acyl hydrolase
MDLLERLTCEGPKRILAVDGGGLRGCISVGYLERIESLLRERYGKPNLVLRDYFDLIGGTSTGSLIAGILITGKSTAELKRIYVGMGRGVFSKLTWRQYRNKYDDTPLSEVIDVAVGDVALDDPSLTCGACIIAKRADTESTWPILNHPHGKYYESNRHILLKNAIRASGAAPSYFEPKVLDVGMGESAAFVDGGVSMANNPALQLFLVATLEGFPFHWKTGEDQLLITSLGTGVFKKKHDIHDVHTAKLWEVAKHVPDMLIEDGSWLGQLMLQYMSNSPLAETIDSEIGNLANDLLTPEPLLTYLRYNVWLEPEVLEELGLPHFVDNLERLREMDNSETTEDLYEIGRRAADRQVEEGHFAACFDPPPERLS